MRSYKYSYRDENFDPVSFPYPWPWNTEVMKILCDVSLSISPHDRCWCLSVQPLPIVHKQSSLPENTEICIFYSQLIYTAWILFSEFDICIHWLFNLPITRIWLQFIKSISELWVGYFSLSVFFWWDICHILLKIEGSNWYHSLLMWNVSYNLFLQRKQYKKCQLEMMEELKHTGNAYAVFSELIHCMWKRDKIYIKLAWFIIYISSSVISLFNRTGGLLICCTKHCHSMSQCQ